MLVSMFALLFVLPAVAGNKKHGDRAMIEKMEAVPCGAKKHGLTGLGSLWGSVGATHVNTDEKLCPQYLLRTDDMEYHIRPVDKKHPVILPIGKEGEFKISKDVMEMRLTEGDHKKRRYQVVAMKPIDHSEALSGGGDKTRYESRKDYSDKDKDYTDKDKPLAAKTGQKVPVAGTAPSQ
jgi:hypothetical protein